MNTREKVAEDILRALHADFTTYNKAKIMLLLRPLGALWPEPWQTEINKIAAERDELKRQREKVLALAAGFMPERNHALYVETANALTTRSTE